MGEQAQVKIDDVDEMGAEDFVSESLIKDSPHVKTKKVTKNE